MVKLFIKLAIVGLIAHAVWRVGSAYVTFYRFQDAVAEIAQFGAQQSGADLRQRVGDLASQYELPLSDDAFTVRRDERNHTYIDGSYVQPLEFLPGYRYPWTFTWHVDVLTLSASPPDPLRGR
jgi:hypothetical protein